MFIIIGLVVELVLTEIGIKNRRFLDGKLKDIKRKILAIDVGLPLAIIPKF
tara:strand:- start:1431 stop:1583 length:153 start_codon:yes stop_codon:yes gene_type:complete